MQINHPTYLTGVERSGIGKDGVFCSDYVNLVRTASSKLTRDMVNMSKCHVASCIVPSMLNCREIKKEQLAEWLYTAYYLLEQCSLPLMGLAAKKNGQLEKLKDEKIADLATITDLQKQVIEMKDEQLNSVKVTVQDTVKETVTSELRSYSSVVSKSCSAALEPKKIVSAVRKVTEVEDRSRNVVVFGMPEEVEENLDLKVDLLLN